MIDDSTREVYLEERPWGRFEQFTHNAPSSVKLLYINPGEQISLQYHHKRQEFWRVLQGDPHITVGDAVYQAQVGDEFYIAQEEIHRISGGTQQAIILEIAFGDFDESDIVRLEDNYGRTTDSSTS